MCFVTYKISLLQNALTKENKNANRMDATDTKDRKNIFFHLVKIIKIIICYDLRFSLPSFVVVEIPL